MQNQRTNVHLVSPLNQDKKTTGEVTIQFWDGKDRMRRALQSLAICWGGAIVAIFLPLIHFVLVPLLLIAGPIVASVIHGQKDVILGGEGTCPHCGKPIEIVRSKLHWPLTDLCTACHQETRIYPDEALSAAK